MKLLSDIINELIDTDKTIGSPMLKTKVLAVRIQNQELLNWVNNELKGYDLSQDLPQYRIYKCHVTGTFTNGSMKYTEVPIATKGLPQGILRNLDFMRFEQSITTLERHLDKNTSGSLDQKLPAELNSTIEENIREMGNPFYHLVSARKTLSISAVNEIVSVVRNKLLDFVLKLDEEFGNITEINDLKSKSKQIQSMVHNTIITSSGEGNIINTGENARIKASINISKGNKTELRKEIQEIGLSEQDARQLTDIIDEDIPDYDKKKFGEKVNKWMQDMIGKSLNGTWNISIGAAGNLLAELIQKYYGM